MGGGIIAAGPLRLAVSLLLAFAGLMFLGKAVERLAPGVFAGGVETLATGLGVRLARLLRPPEFEPFGVDQQQIMMIGPKDASFADRLSATADAKKAQLERAAERGLRPRALPLSTWLQAAARRPAI